MRPFLPGICFICVSITVGSALAKSDKELAIEYFQEAAALYSDGKYEEAAAKFRQAQDTKPSWRLWFNIGQSEAACRNYGLALDAFEKYLSLGGDNIAPARFEEVVAEVKRLRELVGNIRFENGPDGADVLVDGVKRAQLPLSVDLRVPAGVEHEVKIVQDGAVVHKQKIAVGSASHVTIKINDHEGPAHPFLETSTASNEPVSEESPAKGDSSVDGKPAATSSKVNLRPLKIALLTSLGLTVATAGTGLGFWLAAGSKEDALNSLRADYEGGDITRDEYDTEFDKTNDTMETYDGVKKGMLITSGVFAATSVVLTIVLLKKRKASSDVSLLGNGLSIRF